MVWTYIVSISKKRDRLCGIVSRRSRRFTQNCGLFDVVESTAFSRKINLPRSSIFARVPARQLCENLRDLREIIPSNSDFLFATYRNQFAIVKRDIRNLLIVP